MATGAEIIVDLSDNDDDDDCVIESVSYKPKNKGNKNIIFDDIFKENPLLAEVIEKCFNLESSEGMLRVINKTLVGVYKEADPGFKSSTEFEAVLKKTLINLDRDPNHKFSHIKDLCEKLRASKFKKRVQLITLEKKIRKKSLLQLKAKRKSSLERKSKKQKTDVIDLDKYEEIPIINLDQNDSTDDCPIVIDDEKENYSAQENNNCILEINSDELTDPEVNSENLNYHKVNEETLLSTEDDKEKHSSQENDDCLMEINDDEPTLCENDHYQIDIDKTNLENANKYNKNVGNTENDLTTYDNSRKSISKENSINANYHIQTNKKELINNNHDKQSHIAKVNGHYFPRTNLQSHTLGNSPEKLLIPHKLFDLSMEDEPSKMADLQKIKNIEIEIAQYKEYIMKLDEQEVTDDSCLSPYVMSEKYKAKIVQLYKELCTLTGTEVTKRREVRLTVIEGHPPGPVQRLERFLNRNIGEDGNPPFPDFNDVVKCVELANQKDNLGWDKPQVMREASALFVHCGRALQKRRQRREWSDLLSRVKAEKCEDDPADNDPELLARLEANRQVAVKKEADLLQRYTMMQYLAPELNNTKNVVKGQAANEVSSNESVITVIDKSSDKNDPPQVNNVFIAPTKENNTNQLDRNEIIVSSISYPRESISYSKFVRKQHINSVHNTGLVMPQIIAESVTNKIYTDEFGLKINDSRNISNVEVNLTTNIAANFESNIGELDNPCNFKTGLIFEPNIEDSNLKCEANYNSNIESNIGEVNGECNVATNETNISRLSFEPNSTEVNSIETIVKTESDEVDINECNVAANKTNVARLNFESNDSVVKCKANVQVNSESNVEVNFGSNTEVISTEVSFEMESDKVNIKTEPTQNIAKLLNDLGDNYTVSIFDIEDPFLVIHISDSSDEDD